jgi:glucose dehydrogenase
MRTQVTLPGGFLGSFEELDALGIPGRHAESGRPHCDSGRLVLIAASQDARPPRLRAHGKVLWVADLTRTAVPSMTYQGKRGKQYVAIMAGGGRPVARKVDESRIGGRLHVFALSDAR